MKMRRLALLRAYVNTINYFNRPVARPVRGGVTYTAERHAVVTSGVAKRSAFKNDPTERVLATAGLAQCMFPNPISVEHLDLFSVERSLSTTFAPAPAVWTRRGVLTR